MSSVESEVSKYELATDLAILDSDSDWTTIFVK